MLHSQVELEHLLVHVCTNWGWNSGYNIHLCRWTVKLSYTILWKLYKWGVEHSTIFCFVMQLVQIRGGRQYNILLCNSYKWGVEHNTMFCYATCTNEGWNTIQCFVMQPVQMRGGTQYNILFCYATCTNEGWNIIFVVQMNYHGNKAFQANNWSWNAWWRWYSPQ